MSNTTSTPKKIRILTALNGQELFGHERGNLEVFKAMREAGAEVCIGVTSRGAPGAVHAEVARLGFQTFPIPFGFQWSKAYFKKQPSLILQNIKHAWNSNRAFAKQIELFKPTHLHLGNFLAFSFLSRAVRRAKLPLIVRLGDGPPTESPVQMWLWQKFINAAAVIVANSQYVWKASAAVSAKMARGPECVIHNQAPESSQNERTANFDPSKQNIVYVGQLSKEKGVFMLVDALSILTTQFPNIHLHLVGGSIYTHEANQELIEQIGRLNLTGKITLHGWVDNARDFYRSALVHVAPSLWEEPFCNVILEAKREGTPSVSFASGGIPEMIQHLVDGYLCQDRTPAALAEGIASLLMMELSEKRTMCISAKERYHENFGSERFRREWLKAYARTSSI
jgi:glycosyltransferase involved in cell wall biosynthesis